MTTNPFFRSNYASPADQSLVQSLIIEAIKIFGRDMYYVSRELVAKDKLYGEDKLSAFNKAYTIEFYVDSVLGFAGERDIISKFGIEIRDELKLTVAKQRFRDVVSAAEPTISRPREGDLIFFPLDNRLFEITFVEDEQVFHQLGKLYTYDISLKKFDLAAETFDTGVDQIDEYGTDFAEVTTLYLGTGTGTFSVGETAFQGVTLTSTSVQAEVIGWDAGTMALSLVRTRGEFVSGTNIKGNTSGANWTYTASASDDQNSNDPFKDNEELDSKATGVIDFSEKNPYSEE